MLRLRDSANPDQCVGLFIQHHLGWMHQFRKQEDKRLDQHARFMEVVIDILQKQNPTTQWLLLMVYICGRVDKRHGGV